MTHVTPETMSVLALLLVLGDQGCVLSTKAGKLYVSNRRRLPNEALAAIARHRDLLLTIVEVAE